MCIIRYFDKEENINVCPSQFCTKTQYLFEYSSCVRNNFLQFSEFPSNIVDLTMSFLGTEVNQYWLWKRELKFLCYNYCRSHIIHPIFCSSRLIKYSDCRVPYVTQYLFVFDSQEWKLPNRRRVALCLVFFLLFPCYFVNIFARILLMSYFLIGLTLLILRDLVRLSNKLQTHLFLFIRTLVCHTFSTLLEIVFGWIVSFNFMLHIITTPYERPIKDIRFVYRGESKQRVILRRPLSFIEILTLE